MACLMTPPSCMCSLGALQTDPHPTSPKLGRLRLYKGQLPRNSGFSAGPPYRGVDGCFSCSDAGAIETFGLHPEIPIPLN